MGRYGQTFRAKSDIKLMVSMFDNFIGTTGYGGNFANDASQIMYPTPPTISLGNATRFGYRQPVRADGTTPYWFLQGTGDTATEQAIVTEQIDMLAEAGVYGVILLYYPQAEHVTSHPSGETPPRDPWSKNLWQWAKYYFTSSSKSKLKFAVMCPSQNASYDVNTGTASQEFSVVGTYLNLPNFAAYWATLMQDSQYAKDSSGLPFFYLYDAGDTWTAGHRDTITTAATNAGISGVHYVHSNQSDAQASALNADLGGYNNGIGVGTQNSYQTQITKDRSFWIRGTSLRNKQIAMAHMNDGRVARGVATWWTDHAIYSEVETNLVQTFGFARSALTKCPDGIVTIYSGGELAEGGEFFPTRQTVTMGPNSPGRGPWFDGIKNTTRNSPPATWPNVYAADAVHANIVRTGGANWTTTNSIHNGGGSNPAPYRFIAHRNVTVGNTYVLTETNCTRIQVIGDLGPGLGTSNMHIDAGSDTLVTNTAGSPSYGVLLYDSGVLAKGTHSITITIVTGVSFDRIVTTKAR